MKDKQWNDFPEMQDVVGLADTFAKFGTVNIETTVTHKGKQFPIYSFAIGNLTGDVPTYVLTAGVHGLERIGSKVLIAYMKTFLELLEWDLSFRNSMNEVRILFYPLVNPVGMYFHSRSNGRGVDIMRNAPIEAEETHKFAFVSGQRISPKLPWFRGYKNDPMEIETAALVNFLVRHLKRVSVAVAVDVHSGFGTVDRVWFPYAKSRKPFRDLPEAMALKNMLDRTYPNHVYVIEPQSDKYTTHGDVWDYVYDELKIEHADMSFVPFCLELGSWSWAKKNPRQIFSLLGVFNPILPHRRRRTLRRHLLFFDFLLKVTRNPQAWSQLTEKQRYKLAAQAYGVWYTHLSRQEFDNLHLELVVPESEQNSILQNLRGQDHEQSSETKQPDNRSESNKTA